jgi:hypothetical protein
MVLFIDVKKRINKYIYRFIPSCDVVNFLNKSLNIKKNNLIKKIYIYLFGIRKKIQNNSQVVRNADEFQKKKKYRYRRSSQHII